MSAISSGELKEVCDERGLLYSSMILPDNIVEVFALSQPRKMPQPASTLHLCGGTPVGRVFVDGDHAQIAGMNLRQCLAKEMLRRGGVSPRREQEVDRLAQAIHDPLEIGPGSLDLDIGLVYPP
jgi:hypothetical protein